MVLPLPPTWVCTLYAGTFSHSRWSPSIVGAFDRAATSTSGPGMASRVSGASSPLSVAPAEVDEADVVVSGVLEALAVDALAVEALPE
ncbi:hypothetical protein GCM10028781_29270 [Nostocoides australiense]